jgi:hypothetical protein
MADSEEAMAVPGPDDFDTFEDLIRGVTADRVPSWSDVQKLSFEQNSAARVCTKAFLDGNMQLVRAAADDYARIDAEKSRMIGILQELQDI